MATTPTTRAARPGRRAHLAGTAFAIAGAGCYGVTIVIGRALAKGGLDASNVLGLRFGIAGLGLIVGLILARRPLLPVRGERLAAVALGAVGYASESSLFYLALSRGTAAAVALLFYSYPAMVTLAEAVLRRSRPRPMALAALALSFAGAVLLAVSGGHVDISTAGALFAIGAAAAFSAYLLITERVMRRSDSMTIAAWTALGASAALLTRTSLRGGIHLPVGHTWQLLTYGLATGAAFALMFAALRRLGSAQTAVVMTLEAVCAIVLAAAFLGEGIGPIQIVGGAAILGAAVLISLQAGAASEAPATLAT